MDWDDLKAALALARAGSVRQAARDLGVSHSTVLRRLHSLEEATGARLFERTEEGYEATAAGQDVFDTATQLEEIVVGLERRVTAAPLWVLTHRDLRTTSRVRVLRDFLVAGLRERRAMIEATCRARRS